MLTVRCACCWCLAAAVVVLPVPVLPYLQHHHLLPEHQTVFTLWVPPEPIDHHDPLPSDGPGSRLTVQVASADATDAVATLLPGLSIKLVS